MSEGPPQKNEIVEEGAPDWVVTFGDLMSLLLCFFVLLLSFSEMDKQKYREVAGSLADAFGVQRKTPVFESPKGRKIIARDFDQDLATRKKEELGREIEKEMENSLQDIKDLIQVQVDEGRVLIRLMGETAFNSGKAEIREQMMPLLKKISATLEQATGDIVVAGHTDNIPVQGGQFKSNLRLSMFRAASVAEFFLSQAPIDPQRISTIGYGEYRPIESNETESGREKNRRVEIILKPSVFPKKKKEESHENDYSISIKDNPAPKEESHEDDYSISIKDNPGS